MGASGFSEIESKEPRTTSFLPVMTGQVIHELIQFWEQTKPKDMEEEPANIKKLKELGRAITDKNKPLTPVELACFFETCNMLPYFYEPSTSFLKTFNFETIDPFFNFLNARTIQTLHLTPDHLALFMTEGSPGVERFFMEKAADKAPFLKLPVGTLFKILEKLIDTLPKVSTEIPVDFKYSISPASVYNQIIKNLQNFIKRYQGLKTFTTTHGGELADILFHMDLRSCVGFFENSDVLDCLYTLFGFGMTWVLLRTAERGVTTREMFFPFVEEPLKSHESTTLFDLMCHHPKEVLNISVFALFRYSPERERDNPDLEQFFLSKNLDDIKAFRAFMKLWNQRTAHFAFTHTRDFLKAIYSYSNEFDSFPSTKKLPTLCARPPVMWVFFQLFQHGLFALDFPKKACFYELNFIDYEKGNAFCHAMNTAIKRLKTAGLLNETQKALINQFLENPEKITETTDRFLAANTSSAAPAVPPKKSSSWWCCCRLFQKQKPTSAPTDQYETGAARHCH